MVIDNNSTDGTKNILKKYEDKGILKYYFKSGNSFEQAKWMTELAIDAHTLFKADWVINNDADEFWFPKKSNNLRELFTLLPPYHNLITAERSNFVAIAYGLSKYYFYENMIYKEINPKNPRGEPLPPKIAHKSSAFITLGGGNHSISGISNVFPIGNVIEIFHFPVRNKKQYERKIVNLGAGKEKLGKVNDIRVTFYKNYQKDPTYLKNQFNTLSHTSEEIEHKLFSGELIEDTRLQKIMKNISNKG